MERWFEHYNSSQEILLVGKDDFSFSACLTRALGSTLVDFDVILGADWLHYKYVDIHYREKTVTFRRPGLPGVTFVGERSGVRHVVISALREKKLLIKGYHEYLAHVVLNDIIPSSIEEVRVVRHFPRSFLMICLDYHLTGMWSLPSTYFQVQIPFL